MTTLGRRLLTLVYTLLLYTTYPGVSPDCVTRYSHQIPAHPRFFVSSLCSSSDDFSFFFFFFVGSRVCACVESIILRNRRQRPRAVHSLITYVRVSSSSGGSSFVSPRRFGCGGHGAGLVAFTCTRLYSCAFRRDKRTRSSDERVVLRVRF